MCFKWAFIIAVKRNTLKYLHTLVRDTERLVCVCGVFRGFLGSSNLTRICDRIEMDRFQQEKLQRYEEFVDKRLKPDLVHAIAERFVFCSPVYFAYSS